MRRPVPPILVVTCLLVGMLAGILFQKFYGAGRIIGTIWKADPHFLDISPAPDRVEVPLAAITAKKRRMIALVFGQSNSANFGETPRTSMQDVYNYYKRRLYRAQDPLLGATGTGGSVWTRLGDKLIAQRLYDAVVFVPLGVDATRIARWQSSGDLHPSLLGAIEDLNRHGLPVTHMLWHQGESDAVLKTSKPAYKAMFHDMLAGIRKHGVSAPIYVAIATRCEKNKGDRAIQEAQAELVDVSAGIYPGPNTDSLGWAYRYDGCHFSDDGLERGAELWLNALEAKSAAASQQ